MHTDPAVLDPAAVGSERRLQVVGHRGDPYRARENTLASLRNAFAQGADAVEIDVRLTTDKVPVLLHDDNLSRLWGKERSLYGLSARDVRDLTGGQVPTLHEALEACPGRFMIDLPGATASTAAAVVDTVQACGADQRVCYCAGANTMLAVRAADPTAEIALTWTTSCPPRRSLLSALAPRWLNYRFGLISRELVHQTHAEGLLVSAWTADTRRTMRALLAAGVDSVTTNRVTALVKERDAVRGGRGG
ncbi:glycerophosphodiester phosphodiesterase [Streptomyces sp. NPDC006879]|uniref:glycerophosphodiester phosphodiesterase n=1 Tax=Streptomyces sp. NPDC006879 TaxID=3364767 RepID=UPI0036B63B2F